MAQDPRVEITVTTGRGHMTRSDMEREVLLALEMGKVDGRLDQTLTNQIEITEALGGSYTFRDVIRLAKMALDYGFILPPEGGQDGGSSQGRV